MSNPAGVSVQFRLSAASLDFGVEVRLRSLGDRWIAVADIRGEPQLGLGSSARQALTASLAALGRRAMDALLADPALLGPSCVVLADYRRRAESG